MHSSCCPQCRSAPKCQRLVHCNVGCENATLYYHYLCHRRKKSGVACSSSCVLDVFLRTMPLELISNTIEAGVLKPRSRLRWYEPFSADPGPALRKCTLNAQAVIEKAFETLRPLQTTSGPERHPLNKHPAIICISSSIV
ncbi:hypothetical protein BDQ12DRAFT_687086 [Crucibulum laeve]|uniref:Uncharacterized protein n=1 Tax=Crucibulum laeve TaxID=68775 RepID=A0A5C3LSR4_9AGAR|nr:hypothetical protein BDQ12DRAFT_687086 [Crucibulum laeve]